MEAVRVRDWLARLHGAGGAQDIGKFRGIVGEMAKVQPGLAGEACVLAGEYFEGGEIWCSGVVCQGWGGS